MPTTVGLLGTGRLGSAIRAAADGRPDVRIAWAVGRHGPDADSEPVDVAIDASTAQAVPGHLGWAARTGTPLVVGTTGWDPGGLVDPPVPVLLAPNFSLGVALVRRFALLLGGYAASAATPVDLAVTETHHRHKTDSPSGTAISLSRALARGAGRSPAQVQTTSLRLGEVVGAHEVIAASALETVSVRHVAHHRTVFATGALLAAAWLAARPTPGIYTLDDLAEDHLRHLLYPTTTKDDTPCPRA